MSAPRVGDALAHLAEAMDALTIESWTLPVGGVERRTPAIEATIAEDLMRVHCAIAPRDKPSIFSIMAEEVRRAVIEIEAARQALGAEPS
ncbi:hypothetical protein [Sphingobium ummariense]|uniref:Uncharacterized protein n=1 Tax=Sphingobium ummariense RL-3 TaxID=1346791 RepID=T0IT57_9SPHN|nr:hypothetical protein [Sphingobium ummariense]EQB32035.1 hypothetical protein M529_11870 [Sphingobium ummariense RL-3]